MSRSSLCRGLRSTKPGICLASTASAQRFDGKVAVITGCTDGIGLAIAEVLGEEGASIVVNSRKQENVDKTVERFREKGVKVTGITCHADSSDDRKKLLQHTLNEFGRIDILVANAAHTLFWGPLFETPEDTWDKIFDTNVKGTFFLCKEALPELEKTKGSILLMSTFLAFHPYQNLAAHAVSKAALLGLVKAMAPECAKIGVRVNAMAPGMIETRFTAKVRDTPFGKKFLKATAMERMGQTREVAAVARFLLSDEASYITGETIAVAGGHPSRL